MLRERLYAAYTWRVRHFREGETNETLVRFTPDGQPYGFVETLKEDAPGAALDAAEARRRAEADASTRWRVDLSPFALVEQGQERRPGGRVDHTLTYERSSPTLGEGRYRLRLVVSGDRLTEVTYFVKIPEAFTRRYGSMRSANEAIGIGSARRDGAALCSRRHRHRPLLHAAPALRAVAAGGDLGRHRRHAAGAGDPQRVAADVDDLRHGGPAHDVHRGQIAHARRDGGRLLGVLGALVHGGGNADAPRVRHHPQFWRVWTKGPGSSTAILGQTAAGYLLVSLFFAYDVALYLIATRASAGGRRPRRCCIPMCSRLTCPGSRRSPTRSRPGFWEECLFRAVPLAGAALIGDRFGKRGLFLVIALHRPGDHLRRGTRAVSDAAILCAPGRAHPSVDRIRAALRLLRPAARHRPALRVRCRLVRAADLSADAPGSGSSR